MESNNRRMPEDSTSFMKNSLFRTPKSVFSTLRTALPIAMLLLASISFAQETRERPHERHDNRPPRIPAELRVPAGHEFQSRATGVGVQIYVWTANPTNAALASWVFKAPHAVLFASHKEERGELVGIHFAGPAWQDNDGSKVIAGRVASATIDSTAIPWLLLQATSTSGEGNFTGTTYIQRLTTVGGLAPSAPGSTLGEESLVPYIADYHFFRAIK